MNIVCESSRTHRLFLRTMVLPCDIAASSICKNAEAPASEAQTGSGSSDGRSAEGGDDRSVDVVLSATYHQAEQPDIQFWHSGSSASINTEPPIRPNSKSRSSIARTFASGDEK